MNHNKSKYSWWRLITIVFIVIALLVGLSYLPLEKWSDGHLKNINILGDIFTSKDSTFVTNSSVEIDEELLEAMSNAGKRDIDTTVVACDSTPVIAIQPSIIDGQVVIEDYTRNGDGLKRIKTKIANGKASRIAVVGDSYIEGDIFTQNLRELLQSEYGGSGVGYMNLHSEFPGFRKSIRQSGDGWTEYSANKKCDRNYIGLPQHYFIPSSNAIATYRGTSSIKHVDSWDISEFMFISPNDCVISTRSGKDSEWVQHTVNASSNVQAISIGGRTDDFSVKTENNRLIALGVWLNDSTGISLDCMSSRGFSGLTLKNINAQLCHQMAKFIDYDLIILEFGINAISPGQTDFSVYQSRMEDAVNHVRECYPNADILIMGIGDRGERRAGEVHSIKSAPYMVDAQRELARRTRTLFWDTREAMGGEDAIVEWSRAGLANKDFVHLSHKGGAKLAQLLFDSIQQNLNNK